MYKKIISLCTILFLLMQSTTYAAASDIAVSSNIDENILTETLFYQDDLQKAIDNASKQAHPTTPGAIDVTSGAIESPPNVIQPTSGAIGVTPGAIEAKRAQLQKDITATTYLKYIKDLGYYKKKQ